MTHPNPCITIETLFPALSKKSPDIVALIKISHPPMEASTALRTKLNIVFAIDVSGSMSALLSNSPTEQPIYVNYPVPNPVMQPPMPAPNMPWPLPGVYFGVNPNHTTAHFGAASVGTIKAPNNPKVYPMPLPSFVQAPQYQTKLDRVKKAAISAILQLQENDCFGVVSFDSNARVIVESMLATEQAKKEAVEKISQLCPGSATALHAGWKNAAEMVCRNLDLKKVNRVLLLTDGEATDGIKDIKTLSSHTNAMAKHGVTTSTFGVGDHYNETLMQSMAESGDGRYYYMEGDSNFEQLFAEEFLGMSKLYGNDIRLRVHADVKTVLDFHNDLPVTPEGWKLPNAIHGKTEYYLVTLKNTRTDNKEARFMVAYDYKHEGTAFTVSIEHTLPVVSEKNLALMKENDNVGRKWLELETARAKEKAIQALDQGNYGLSQSILRASCATIGASMYAAEASFQAQTSRLDTLMAVGDSGDHGKMRKMSSHDTYATRNNHND